VDDFHVCTAAQNTQRQHARSMDDLPRHIDRHEADHLATRLGCLPFPGFREVEILENFLTVRNDFFYVSFTHGVQFSSLLITVLG